MYHDLIAVTIDEFNLALDSFISNECEKNKNLLIHKDCGGAIRIGFLNLFYLNQDGSLDPGNDGFGIGPKKVPYCERCFPPDGFNHTYAIRFPILRQRSENLDENYKFTWGNREVKQED